MTAGRPRTSTDPHASRKRTWGDVELADHVPTLELPERDWLPETVQAFNVYAASEAARALRAEDCPEVVRLFDYRDQLARFAVQAQTCEFTEMVKLTQTVKTIEAMALALAAHLGIGPAPRTRLSITTMPKPGSRLEAFMAEGVARAGQRD